MSVLAGLVLAATAAVGGSTKITSANTYYDRKEGFAYFSGGVFVNDAEYQLHADRAYVFMDSTNELKRIVALGNVAVTNGTKRAYGVKASYHRAPGMVILYGDDKTAAEVRDTMSEKGDQVVRGNKIKFWTATEQVEVLEAEISAPSSGAGLGNFKDKLGN